MIEVGVKALKDQLSFWLSRVSDEERIVVTEHDRPIAVLTPIEQSEDARDAWELVGAGIANWSEHLASYLARVVYEAFNTVGVRRSNVPPKLPLLPQIELSGISGWLPGIKVSLLAVPSETIVGAPGSTHTLPHIPGEQA